MKKSIFLLGIVAGMFLVAGGCNDAVDNGMFEAVDNGAPVAPAAQAPEEEVDVPLKASVAWVEELQRIRRVETYGATGLWVVYEVWLYISDSNGKYLEKKCLTKGGRLWAHTYHDLGAYVSPGMIVQMGIKPLGDSDPFHMAATPEYIYDPNGLVETFNVTSFFGDIEIDWK